MSDTMTTRTAVDNETVRLAGTVGFYGAIAITILLVVHPFGTTDLYGTGSDFLGHVNAYWMIIHLLAAATLFTLPPVLGCWKDTMRSAPARFVGGWAHMMSIAGVGVGTIHLVGTDTMTFWAFRDTYDAADGSEAAAIGADVLLRLHAATLSSWVLVFFLAVPLLGGVAALLDGQNPKWVGYLGVVGGLLQIPALIVTTAERQWTTLSEQFIFRTGATLFIVFWIAIGWGLKRGAPIGTPIPAATGSGS